MRYGILGPLEVRSDAREVPLANGKQRLLLAVLLLHANEAIASELLIEVLWGETPPPAAAGSLRNLVSSLRKSLGDGQLITRGHGYLLRITDDELDAWRFEALLKEGRAQLADGDAETASALLREGLGLWRGPALADLAYEPALQDEAARLEEQRLAALEERIEADLALGLHAALVAELAALVGAHPLRERLRGQQILALYRCGRQAEALQAYGDGRRRLGEELGIEPGRALRRLELAVLDQDPALGAPDRLPPAPRRRAGVVSTAVRRPLALVMAGAVLVAAATIAVVAAGRPHARPAGPITLVGDSVAAIDPRSGRIVKQIAVGGTPTSVSVGAGAVWVLNSDDQTIARVDPDTRSVRTVGIGGTPTDLAAGAGALWVAAGVTQYGAERLLSLNADDLIERARTALPPHRHQGTPGLPGQLAVAGDLVWAINGSGDLARIDAKTGRVTATVAALKARSIAPAGDSVWVLTADDSIVVEVDANAASVRRRFTIPAARLDAIATGAGALWATDAYDGTLWRIEPGPKVTSRTITVGAGADGVAVGAGAVWVINSLQGTLVRVDPVRNVVTATVALGNTPRDVDAGEGAVWATVNGGARPVPAAVAHAAKGPSALPSPACGRVLSAAGRVPDYLIASDFPLHNGTQQIANAVAFVLRGHGFRAGRYRVGYQSCDASTADSGQSDPGKCASNAKAYVADSAVIGVVGPYNSACAAVEIPILNRAPDGPLAIISPTASFIGLTHLDPSAPRGALQRLYPTGIRNFARVTPADDAEAAAAAVFAHQLGLRRLYVLDDGSDPSREEWALPFRRTARALGMRIVGSASWDPTGKRFPALVERVRRARPDGVYVSGLVGNNGGPLTARLHARLGPSVTLIGPNLLAPVSLLWDTSHGAARGAYITNVLVPTERLGPRGRNFVRDFGATQPGIEVWSSAVYAAAATEVLLDAIARSDGTRRSVTEQLLSTRLDDGTLGPIRFNDNGELSAPAITMMRVQRGHTGPETGNSFDGATIDRIIVPPTNTIR